MKRTILSAVVAATAFSVMAQGTMQFQNGNTSPIRVVRGGATMTAGALPIDNLVVAMFWGTTASNVNNVGGTALLSTQAGIMSGSASFPVAGGTNPGDTLFFQVAAWDMAFGTTLAWMQSCIAAGGAWGAATGPSVIPGGGGYGVFGAPLPFTLGPTAGPGSVMFGSTVSTGVFHAFSIYAWPEPSTITLLGLGLAVLGYLLRRRK